MPVRDIRTRLSIEGEKVLKQELQAAAREMRVLETGMKAAGAGFDAAGDDMGKLESNSKSLRLQLAQQQEIVKALTNAMRDSADAYGDNSRETDGWKIKLNGALTKQEQLRKAIMDTDREMDELARDSVRAGRQLESGLGESAEDVTRDLRSMYDELKTGMDDIRGSVGFSAFSDAWQMGSGIVSGLTDFTEESRDYRRQMAFLRQNAEAAGLDFNSVKAQYNEILTFADEDGAFEGLNNLIAAGLDIGEIVSLVDELGGAVTRFPETMKFENLAESIQETVATKEATGQFAELLGRLGINVDDFNTAMAAARTEEEAQQVMLSFLANNGLKQLYQGFRDTNPELIAATNASNELRDALANLGGALEPASTAVNRYLAGLINRVGNFLRTKDVIDLIATKAVDSQLPKASRIDNDEAQAAMKEIAKLVQESLGLTDDEVERIKNKSGEYANAVKQGMKDSFKQETKNGLGDWLAAGAEWIDQLFGWNDTSSATEKAADAASEVTAAVRDQINADSPALQSTAFAAGELMMMQMSAGVNEGAAVMLSQLQTAMQSAAGMVSAPIGSGAGFADAGLNNKGLQMGEAVINLDGKQVGNALLPYVNQGMGTALRTNEIY